MKGENQPLVTDELVEFKRKLLELQNLGKLRIILREIYRLYPNFNKETER